ncbi:MAG: hypothetical protein KAY37_14305 [Phycisphaerae bacterium]|nr:hypothetical protein [Phycisphaerae bacterium]
MTTLKASQTRIPPATFNRIVYKGARVRIRHRNGVSIFLISEQAAAVLEALEDRYWAKLADEAISEMEANDDKPIPWETLRESLGV